MGRLLYWIAVIPLFLVVIVFSVTNHATTELSLWPVLTEPVPFPVYGIALVALFLGFVWGGIVSWFQNGRNRRRVRDLQRQSEADQREIVRLRDRLSPAGRRRAAGDHPAAADPAALVQRVVAPDVPTAVSGVRWSSADCAVAHGARGENLRDSATPPRSPRRRARVRGWWALSFIRHRRGRWRRRCSGAGTAWCRRKCCGSASLSMPTTRRSPLILAAVPLDLLQLHGSESPARVADVRARFRLSGHQGDRRASTPATLPPPNAYAGVADRLLFDARPPKEATRPGGNAHTFDWRLLAGRAWTCRGCWREGCRPPTSPRRCGSSGAAAVDVSSGVEDAPGHKSAALIRAFLGAAARIEPAAAAAPAVASGHSAAYI